MSILVGVSPGGQGHFAVCSLFWPGKLPALLIRSRVYSGVDAALDDIVGVCGEWGELGAVVINAPLSWSGSPGGWRPADKLLARIAAPWMPRSWFRAPNAMPGAIAVQGAALAWVLSQEIKSGHLPSHRLLETHGRLALARIADDLRSELMTYRDRRHPAETRKRAAATLAERCVDTGLIRLETEPPTASDEVDALAACVVGLGANYPETGLMIEELAPGDIRPVGRRPIAVLQALP